MVRRLNEGTYNDPELNQFELKIMTPGRKGQSEINQFVDDNRDSGVFGSVGSEYGNISVWLNTESVDDDWVDLVEDLIIYAQGFGGRISVKCNNELKNLINGINESKSKKRPLKKSMKESSVRGDYFGIPGIKFVSNGEWADGGLVFDGKYFNVHDVEDTLWDMFNEYCDETGVICDDDGFEDFMQENEDTVKGLLYDLIESGQYEDLDEVPGFGPFKKSYRRDRGDHPGDYIEFESVRLKRESTNKRRPTSKRKQDK